MLLPIIKDANKSNHWQGCGEKGPEEREREGTRSETDQIMHVHKYDIINPSSLYNYNASINNKHTLF